MFGRGIVAVVVAMIGASPVALADTIAPYGAFAEGGIANSYGQSPATPGVGCSGGCYYFGTDYQNGAGPTESASGSIGTANWGLSSASANLSTGDITVSATSIGLPPFTSGAPNYGAPASATAGYFVEIVFSGGNGEIGSVNIGGIASYSGDVSVTAGATVYAGGYDGIGAGSNIISGTDLAAESDVAWSTPADEFTIEDGDTYTLAAFISVETSGDFTEGSATFSDPLSLDLPSDVTYTVLGGADFLQGPSAVPEPASLALLSSGLFGLGALRRRKRKTA